MKITSKTFGATDEGQTVQLFTLSNDHKITISITNYGGIVTSLEMPDKDGKTDNVVCGFSKLEDYLNPAYLSNYPYFGALIGRFGNRIAKGKYTIDGTGYEGAINNGPNHLHGGLTGFDRRLWTPEIIEEKEKVGLKLSYLSQDKEEGYPGNLKVSCTYTLDNENNFALVYEAETDKATIINLTNHTYFNLTGGKRDILDHELELAADKITESVDLIPTGKILPVAGTAFDFTTRKKISKDLDQLPEGYDQNFVLNEGSSKPVYAGCLSESATGRSVKVYTTQPGIQIYTGYWIPELTIDGVKKFGKYSGIAMETQHFPDSPHYENFPSTLLRPEEKYSQTTIFQLG